MEEDNLVLSLALFAVVISAIGVGFNYYVGEGITGLATTSDLGKVNITVSQNLAIRFQPNYKVIDWGSGYVNLTDGNTFATLDTAKGSVVNGTWTNTSQKLVIENTGNINCSLYLKTGKTNQTFIGGGGAVAQPSYKYNVTVNETDSCTAASGFTLTAWNDVNTTADYGTKICDAFPYDNSKDEIKIDIQLVVPSDSAVGLLEDTITATGETA